MYLARGCRQWQSIRRPSFWQSVVLCLLSSRFRRIEHQIRWNCTAFCPRSVALRIRSLPHEARHRRCGGNYCFCHALLLDGFPRAVVAIDDNEDDLAACMRSSCASEQKALGSDVDADGFESSSQALGRTREGFQPSVHISIWKRHSYQFGATFLQLSALDSHSTFEWKWFWNLYQLLFHDARRRSADDALPLPHHHHHPRLRQVAPFLLVIFAVPFCCRPWMELAPRREPRCGGADMSG